MSKSRSAAASANVQLLVEPDVCQSISASLLFKSEDHSNHEVFIVSPNDVVQLQDSSLDLREAFGGTPELLTSAVSQSSALSQFSHAISQCHLLPPDGMFSIYSYQVCSKNKSCMVQQYRMYIDVLKSN